MDVQMPQMDGIQACKAIRAFEEHTTGHIPIIALTAGALKEEREACITAGMDNFLTKPIDIEALKKVILQHLPSNAQSKDESSFDKLALMKRVGQNTTLYRNFLETSKNLPQKINALEQAIQKKDVSESKRIAHSIKGVASMLSFLELAKLSETMEVNQNLSLTEQTQLIEDMRKEWEYLIKIINSELGT
jgi:CheY-like chemotaxis protein